jgi:hypothetical protein
MAKQMPRALLLDQLEESSWPSFVTDLKRLAKDPEHPVLTNWLEGTHLSSQTNTTFYKLIISNLPKNTLRWPAVAEVKNCILPAYTDSGRPWERMSEWIYHIGWLRFFELNNVPFIKHHIEDWCSERNALSQSV